MNTYVTRHRALLGALALSTVAVLGLSACSADSSDASTDGKVTLTLHSWLPTQDQWPALIAAFEDENPDVDITFTREEDYDSYLTNLDNEILADDVPDLFGIQVGASFDDYADYALDTDEYASDWLGGVNEESLEETTTEDGTVAAVPILRAGMEYYLYNQTLFDELGLELPTDYASLVATSEAARDAGYSPFAMGAADTWHSADFFVWLSNQYGDGGDIYKAADGQIPWDSEPLVDAATQWQKLFTDGVFQDAATTTTTYPSARDDFFLAGKSIAMPTGSWHVSATLSNSPEVPGSAVEGDALGMAPFPTIGEHPAGSTSGVDFALAINADIDDSKRDAAAKFVEFMAVGQGQQDWVNTLQGFPVANEVSVEITPDESKLAQQSVQSVTDSLRESTYPRKLSAPDNESLETDLGVVLQNIATGADPADELSTLNQ